MMENFNELANKYGGFVLFGVIGAVIHRLRTKMSLKRFLSLVVISSFVSFCAGIISRNYFQLDEELTMVVCGISGVFSETFLNEIQEGLKNISNYIKRRFK